LYEQALKLIENSNDISLITHINVDADSYASAVALMLFIQKHYRKKVHIINKDTIPRNLAKLYPEQKVKNEVPLNSNLMIFVDCANSERAGIYAKDIKSMSITIDHHKIRDRFATVEIIDPSAVSTAILVYKLLESSGKDIDGEVAQALFCALASDSQFFTLDRSNKECYEIASILIGLGAKPFKADEILNKSDSLAKFRLKAEVMSKMELALDGRVAIMSISEELFKKTGASRVDTEGFVDIPLSIECVEAALILIEMQNFFKVSLRSKHIDVAKVAQTLNGGGHMKAAGCKIVSKNVEEAKKVIIQKLKEEL